MLARVVGKHCESGDIVVKDAWLPADVRPGDLLAVAATGAYCRSMASTYNHVPRPPVVAVSDAGTRVLLRRQSHATVLMAEVTGIDPAGRVLHLAGTADLGYEGIEIMGKRPHLSILDNVNGARARAEERAGRRGGGRPSFPCTKSVLQSHTPSATANVRRRKNV